jgi:hypothetical protein
LPLGKGEIKRGLPLGKGEIKRGLPLGKGEIQRGSFPLTNGEIKRGTARRSVTKTRQRFPAEVLSRDAR